MGDGSHAGARIEQSQAHPLAWIGDFFAWLFNRRSGRLFLWAVAAFVALVAVLFSHALGPTLGILNSPTAKIGFVGASALFVLPVALLFLDSNDNLHRGPTLALPTISLGLLVTLTALAAYDAQSPQSNLLGSTGTATDLDVILARAAFFAFLAIAFIPHIWNASNFAKYEENKQKSARRAQEASTGEDDTEAMSALVATVFVLLIGALAVVAGSVGSTVAFENFYGLVLCGLVIGVFAVVIFLDTLAETAFVQSLGRGMQSVARATHFLAAFYDWVDTGLVRIGASVAGMGHTSAWRRYIFLAGSLACLSILAWFLPAPLGLVPAALGFLLAVSVSRLWAWVEEDRALAAMTKYNQNAPYRAGFREDFRDETLLGFVFVFILLPIAMMQAHEGHLFGYPLFDNAENRPFWQWLGFFGVELAKAVPIVDWAEIYNIRPGDDLIGFTSPAARHSVFLARIMVDLVLIASLLQAIGVTTRSRQLKRLYAAGHIQRLDELLERKELSKSIRASRKTDARFSIDQLVPEEAHKHFEFKRMERDGLIDFRRYDQDRLRYLYWSSAADDVRAFVAALSVDANGFKLDNAMDLTIDIADTHKNEVAMNAAFLRALEDHDAGIRPIEVEDLYITLTHLRKTHGLRDFKELLIDTMVRVGSADEVLDKLTGLAGGPSADTYQYTRKKISAAILNIIPSVQSLALLKESHKIWTSWTKNQRPNCAEYRWAIAAMEARLKAGGGL